MIERHLQPLLREALGEFPVVAILGGRQVGKSTLSQALPSPEWPARYFTLDDRALLDAALRDPDGFADGLPRPAIVDEVQRAPEILRSLKRIVDRDRRPGLFVITGSANIVTLAGVSESLAGRVAVFELHPFSWPEIHRRPPPVPLLDALFSEGYARDLVKRLARLESRTTRPDLQARILAGGLPVPALMRPGRLRSRWFESYRQTYLERDLRDLARAASLPDYARLLTSAALRSGQLLNTAEVSRDLGIPLNTVRRHLGLLETTYQISTIQPYFASIGKRIVKTPKIFFNDTGLACHLLAVDDWNVIERQGRAGAIVETWVAGELRKLVALSGPRTEVFFWRTHAGREVDFLLARGDCLAAIEVKWAERLTDRDLGGIVSCRQDLAGRLGLAVVLHPGRSAFAVDEKTAAIPFSIFFGAA